VTETALTRALALDAPALEPNDRLHLGTCVSHDIEVVFTADRGFDGIGGVARVDPLDAVAVERLLA
jgi:predicted nucleic acid-binding protein